jgi:hypothetical protein
MKSKKILTLALALIMCLSMLPSLTALAAAPTVQTLAATNVTATSATLNGKVTSDGGKAVTTYEFLLRWKEGKYNVSDRYDSKYVTGFVINGDTFSYTAPLIEGGTDFEYYAIARNGGTGNDVGSGEWVKVAATGSAPAPTPTLVPEPTDPPSSGAPWSNASGWAIPELEKANGYGLIPAILNGKDFTQSITRAEFAELVVQMLETLIGAEIAAAPSGTFTDADSLAIRKAYESEIITGRGGGIFDPDAAVTREDLATMVGRILPLEYTAGGAGNGELFIDEAEISDYAFLFVKVMAHFGIMKGTDNYCNPKNNCPREQAIAIVIRSFESLVLYALNGEPTPAPTTPTTPVTPTQPPAPTPTLVPEPTDPPSTGDNSLVGMWRSNQATHDSVLFFNADGTFLRVAMVEVNADYWYTVTEFYKGNYRLIGDTVETTNVTKTSGKVPYDIDVVINAKNIIETGSRSQIMELLNPNHPIHSLQPVDWITYELDPGELVFSNANHMVTSIIGGYVEYERVSE